MAQTHTFCALEAAVLGSWLVKATSVRPVSWIRFGTEALIETLPVEVEPRVPWLAAKAPDSRTLANRAAHARW